jgi:uncharacterized delta-60 repeat protein
MSCRVATASPLESGLEDPSYQAAKGLREASESYRGLPYPARRAASMIRRWMAGGLTGMLLASTGLDAQTALPPAPGANGAVHAATALPDGGLLVAGAFGQLGGAAVKLVGRTAPDGVVLPFFAPAPDLTTVDCLAQLNDGRWWIGGNRSQSGGSDGYLIRVYPDGTIDRSLPWPAHGPVRAVKVLPDGGMLVAGVNVFSFSDLIRLGPDGTRDPGFAPEFNWHVSSLAVQADGRVVVAGEFVNVNGVTRAGVARLHSNGTLDPTVQITHNFDVSCVALDAQERILVGGGFTLINGHPRLRMMRLLPDGGLDSGFQPAFDGQVETIVAQADGGILAGGRFTTVNGQPRRGVALLRVDGSLEESFDSGADGDVLSLGLTGDGRVLAGGAFEQIGGAARSRFAVLGHPGTVTNELVVAGGGVAWNYSGAVPVLRDPRLETRVGAGWQDAGPATRTGNGWHFATGALPENTWLRARGRAGGGWRNGSDTIIEASLWLGPAAEPAFTVAFAGGPPFSSGQTITDFGTERWLEAGAPRVLTVTNTGSSALAGLEISAGNAGAADFEVTGELTEILAPGANSSVEVRFRPRTAGLRRGQLLLSGPVGAEDAFVVPLSGTGLHIDPAFQPAANSTVRSFAVQPDGQVLIAGSFFAINGVSRSRLARLKVDGTLDAGFAPTFTSDVDCIAVQDDGRILIGGSFTTLNGQPRQRLARLLQDGTPDPGFGASANNTVRVIAIDPAGRILIGGSFTQVGTVTRQRLARLLPDGTPDPSFNLTVNGNVECILPLEDGGMLIGGSFQTVAGVNRGNVARIREDGTLVEDFNPSANGTVTGILQQPDGGYVIVGEFARMGGQERIGMAKVNAAGVLDPDYRTSLGYDIESAVMDEQARMILGLRNPWRNRLLVRLHPDGRIDNDFDPMIRGALSASLWAVALQNDGKILLGGSFTTVSGEPRLNLARIPSDGIPVSELTVNGGTIEWRRGGPLPATDRAGFATWDGAAWVDHGAGQRIEGGWRIEGLDLPTHGWVRVRGRATGGQNHGSAWVVEQVEPYGNLRPDVVVETGGATAEPGTVFDFGEGNWFQAGQSRTFTVTNRGSAELRGLAADAGPDFVVDGPAVETLAPGESTTVTVSFKPRGVGPRQGNLRIHSNVPVKSPWVLGLAGTGTHQDADFAPVVTGTGVNAIAETADGGILIGGNFTAIDGTTRNRLARFSADGSLDPAFNPGASSEVLGLAVQPDGRILVGGWFSTLAGDSSSRIGRLLPDGTLDPHFTATMNSTVHAIAIQPDGRILAGGDFSTVNGKSRRNLVRLLDDGTIDPGFSTDVTGTIYSVAVQGDGRILIAGNISSVAGQTRSCIARLLPDGSLDLGFQADASFAIRTLLVQPDGRILLGGPFSTVNGVERNRLARLHGDGSLDLDFNPNANFDVKTLALQADGLILVGGTFTQIGGVSQSRIARLLADGRLDPDFNTAASATVNGIALASDGAILVGGEFSTLGGVARSRLARLPNNGPGERRFSRDPGGRLEWRFSGTTPAPAWLGFDTWSGTEWVNLGEPARVGESWILENAILPASGWLRARAMVSGGMGAASSTRVEILEALGTANPAIEIAMDEGPPLPRFTATADFGSAGWLGEGVVRKLVITNRGGGSLDGLRVSVSGTHAADFSVDPAIPGPVAAGASVEVAIRFIPRGGGTREARLAVTSNVPTHSPFPVIITGGGIHIDPTFNTLLATTEVVDALVSRGRHGAFMAGGFSRGIPGNSQYLMALDPRGGDDSMWSPRINQRVTCVFSALNESVTFGGEFSSLFGSGVTSRRHLARFTPGFTQDAGFQPQPSHPVRAMRPLPDGSLLVGGDFAQIGGVTRQHLARLSSSGSVDPAFVPNIGGTVTTIATQSDGRVIVGGSFSSAGGLSRRLAARLNADGSGDASFNLGNTFGIDCVAVLPDDRILVSGSSDFGSGTVSRRLARLHADGTRDLAFDVPTNGAIHSICLQADGAMLLGGDFTVIAGQPRVRLARVFADGTLDPDFDPTANATVRSLSLDAEGRILAGGQFTSIGGGARSSAARLPNNVPALREILVDAGAGRVEWRVGGSAPQLLFVRFERWNGSGWTDLGGGQHVPGGWRLENADLSGTAWVRALGATIGGFGNGSAGMVESFRGIGDELPALVIERSDGTAVDSGELLSFGAVAVGQTQEIALRVKNAGGGTLDGLAVTRTGPANFSIAQPEDVSLESGESTLLHLRFTPSASGARSGTLRVFANDPTRSPLKIALAGTGFHPPGTFGAWPVLADLPSNLRGPLHLNGPLQLPNLLAYAMDLHPLTATPGDLPAFVGFDPSSGLARFRYRRAKELVGTTLVPETSQEAGAWQPAEIRNLEVVHDGGAWETVVIQVPADRRLFFRLRAE